MILALVLLVLRCRVVFVPVGAGESTARTSLSTTDLPKRSSPAVKDFCGRSKNACH